MAVISDADIRVYTTLSSNNADGFLTSIYDNPGENLLSPVGACQTAYKPYQSCVRVEAGAKEAPDNIWFCRRSNILAL